MTKLDKLNKLLADSTLDIPLIHRKVDKHGSNIKWLTKHLSTRNIKHKSYPLLRNLLSERIGNLVTQPALLADPV